MQESVKVCFEPQPKQQELFDAAFADGINTIYYGGAAGGGKTYAALALLILLCKLYPGSVWCVIRKDTGRLKKNTIKTYRKIVPAGFEVMFNDGVAHMANGSQIIFASENYIKDNDLTWMDGFEPNGFLLEECQELQEITFKKAKLRAGRNILNPMPKPLVLCTGNPSQGWPKDVFYEPFVEGKLPKRFKYIVAKMSDNAKLGAEYIEALETLDEITRQRYVHGNWDAVDVKKAFMYSFSLSKHTDIFDDKPLGRLPLQLWFDFNKDPITCVAAQVDGLHWLRIYREFRLSNSDIDELCDAIKAAYNLDEYFILVYGDASGMTTTALNKNRNYYLAIKENLGLDLKQFKIKKANPGIKNSRVLCNAILQRHPDFKIHRKNCRYLIEDNMFVEVKEVAEGIEIDKTKNKHRTHLLDCERYGLDGNFPNYVRYKV